MFPLRVIVLLSVLLSTLWAGATVRAEEGVRPGSILIGQTVGLTGTVAAPAAEMNAGAQACLDAVNRRGGVHGRRIVLQTLDDGFDPRRTYANAEQLILRERVFALFQGRGTPHTAAILPLLERYGVPLLAPATGAAQFHVPVHPWLFNIRPRYQDEVAAGVKHFATLGLQALALLHVDDAFGKDAREGFAQALRLHGLRAAGVTAFARESPDCQGAAAQVLAQGPQAVLVASSSSNTVCAIRALRARDRALPILTLSNNSSAAFVSELGEDGPGVIVSQVMPVPTLGLTPLAREFIKVSTPAGVPLSYPALEGYVNARVLVEALQRAGPAPTRKKFVAALESMRGVDLGGVVLDFSPQDHTGSGFIELTMIGRDGRFMR